MCAMWTPRKSLLFCFCLFVCVRVLVCRNWRPPILTISWSNNVWNPNSSGWDSTAGNSPSSSGSVEPFFIFFYRMKSFAVPEREASGTRYSIWMSSAVWAWRSLRSCPKCANLKSSDCVSTRIRSLCVAVMTTKDLRPFSNGCWENSRKPSPCSTRTNPTKPFCSLTPSVSCFWGVRAGVFVCMLVWLIVGSFFDRRHPDLQIYAVTPVPEAVGVLQMDRVPDRIKSFYRVNNVRRFRHDRPFHKGPKDRENEFKVI